MMYRNRAADQSGDDVNVLHESNTHSPN
jgi:hypothetical protein